MHGAIVPKNLGKYFDVTEVMEKFSEKREKLFECLWNGTNNLVTRSKFPQRSILYIEVFYNSSIYNDLPILVKEKEQMKDNISSLVEQPFIFNEMIDAMEKRKEKIEKIRLAFSTEISKDIENLIDSLKQKGLRIEEIKC